MKREITFDLPGPPIPIRFPDCNESYGIDREIGLSFYLSASSSC